MKTFRPAGRLTLGVCAVVLLFAAAPSEAAVLFVASNGNNANACTRAAPCRTLQRGVDAAAAGDEVQVLDSGEYGPTVAIDKSITISAVGVTARVTNPADSSSAISIDALPPCAPRGNRGCAASANATVVLRGLLISGLGTGDIGIEVLSVASVHINRCTVERFSGAGIDVATSAQVFITDSVVRDGDSTGIDLPNALSAVIVNSRIENNGSNSIRSTGGADVTIIGSVISGGGANGFFQIGGTSHIIGTVSANNSTGFALNTGEMTIENSVARGNFLIGVSAGSGTVRLSNSVVTNNVIGVDLSGGGTVDTRGNNTISGNGTEVNGGALSPLSAI